MAGFLGTDASFFSDLSLILVWIIGVAAAVGAVNGRRRRVSSHCPVMAIGALVNWIPVLIVMIPAWFGMVGGTDGTPTMLSRIAPLGHGVLGAVTQVLMTYTVVRMYWLEDLPPDRPISLMRATIFLWILTVIGGTAVYVTLYA